MRFPRIQFNFQDKFKHLVCIAIEDKNSCQEQMDQIYWFWPICTVLDLIFYYFIMIMKGN